MLRKEILGTKVRTESGLNKPLTLAKPNNDEDYKNQEFLDTDILLAKDIKRFVKGGGANEDASYVKYTYETSNGEFKFIRNVIIDTNVHDEESMYSQAIQLNDIQNGQQLGSIKIGLSTGGYGISIDNSNINYGLDVRGPINSAGVLYPYYIINNDLSKYKIQNGKWDDYIRNNSSFPINNPTIFSNDSDHLVRYIYVNDFHNIDLDYDNIYKYLEDSVGCIVDALFSDFNEYGVNRYYNVGGIKSIKSNQSSSKVFATDGSIVDLPTGGESLPTLPEFSSNYNQMDSNCQNGKSKYRGFCYYTDPSNASKFKSIGAYMLNSASNIGFYKNAISSNTNYKYNMYPMFDALRDSVDDDCYISYYLHNIHGIYSDVAHKQGYYKSDGTITSVENLKSELGISDSTSGTTQTLISYIRKSEDSSNIDGYTNRGMLGVGFAAYVDDTGNSGSFTVGAYCSASDDYIPSGYCIHKVDPGYNDTFIFPMFDINSDSSYFSTESLTYTLRNIAGIKSDDSIIGYYCNDGSIRQGIEFDPTFSFDGSNNPQGNWVGMRYSDNGISAYANTSGDVTKCPINATAEPILSYTYTTLGEKLRFCVNLNNIESISSRYNGSEYKVYATDGSILDIMAILDNINDTLNALTARVAALEAKQ